LILSYFKILQNYAITEPEVEHYITIVDLLGRVELLDKANTFIKEIPIKPTTAIWGALLGTCRMHKNMELGSFVAKRVFELGPYDSSPHLLLYMSINKLDGMRLQE
ncbi:hypothetical protein GIB67_028523, partial [Kingdonia uniflora]